MGGVKQHRNFIEWVGGKTCTEGSNLDIFGQETLYINEFPSEECNKSQNENKL